MLLPYLSWRGGKRVFKVMAWRKMAVCYDSTGAGYYQWVKKDKIIALQFLVECHIREAV